MSFTTPRRVHFSKDIRKWSTESGTPTIQRLSDSLVNSSALTNTTNLPSEPTRRSTTSNKPTSANNTDQNQITVGVRVRPMMGKELILANTNSVKVNEAHNEISIIDRANKLLKFTCDFVIVDQKSSNYARNVESANEVADAQQQYVYECVGKPLLKKAFDGYNVSIFAYGQTGSGKTYSMIGTSPQPGLIPRFFDDLFAKKLELDRLVLNTHIEISYYEIYNEKIYDLLRSTTDSSNTTPASKTNARSLQIRENPQTGPYIVDLLTLSANTAADAKLWLDIGNKRRATASTNMNQKSSRSHSVFQITLTQMVEHSTKQKDGAGDKSLVQLVTSRINLVDLAGSERINTTFGTNTVVSSSSTNSRFKESTCINKSLLTLGKIICLLSDRQTGPQQQQQTSSSSHLPYRESVLTWLLKESIGGNAKTAMLATVNASSCFLDETLCTLRYAAKTANIKNIACLNRNYKQKYVNEFGQEMEMSLMVPQAHVEFETTLKQMELEWKEKLEEAERLKIKEINDLEKSLIVLYENETRAQNCCLINLNEDPSLSEKLIYLLKIESENDECVTLVGSDKAKVNIHLTGALIAPVHSKIVCRKRRNADEEKFYIEQMDVSYVTYINGEVVDGLDKRELLHGDRIIFGGSHFFRFNNPRSKMNTGQNNNSSNSLTALNSGAAIEFKDYQFAKNEIERKQNELMEKKLSEELDKCKRDGDNKINELKMIYEKNIELIKNDFEKEKKARKEEIEEIKTKSSKKLKQLVHKTILIEKLNEIGSEMVSTNQELDKHEKVLLDEPKTPEAPTSLIPGTPSTSNRRLILKLSEWNSEKRPTTFDKREIIQFHASGSSLFAITLCVTEANKICNSFGFEFEFQKYDVLNTKQGKQRQSNTFLSSFNQLGHVGSFIKAILVSDKRLSLVTLWSLEKFEHKLNILRDIYTRYIVEGKSSSISAESHFITDSTDEWQSLDTFMQREQKLSPRIIENALSQGSKCSKRRLSMLTNSSTNSAANLDMSDLSHAGEKTQSENNFDVCDASEVKRVCSIQTIANNPLLNSIKPSKSFDSNLSDSFAFSTGQNSVSLCNSYVFATCRDALNNNLNSDEDEDDEDEDVALLIDEKTDDEYKVENPKSDLNSKKIPKVDDVYLKLYVRLVYNLNKLFSIANENKSQRGDEEELCAQSNSLNDQSLYSIKIVSIFSQISQFKPDYWCLVNADNDLLVNKLHPQMRKKIKMLKESIGCFFHSIENNLDSVIESKYEILMRQIKELMNSQGEFTFLNCVNSFLNRDNHLLNSVKTEFLNEYVKGVNKNYEIYLNKQIKMFQNLDKNDAPILDFIQSMNQFRMNCFCMKVTNSNNNESIIDYCNYAFQSHFRLTNAVRLIKKDEQQLNIKKYSDQILILLYNILTDSLEIYSAGATTRIADATDSHHGLAMKKLMDTFINAFKMIKNFYKNVLNKKISQN